MTKCKRCQEGRDDFSRQVKHPEKLYAWCDRCRALPTKAQVKESKQSKSGLHIVAERHNARAADRGVPGLLTAQDLLLVLLEYKSQCARCGSKKNLEFDHITPLAADGPNDRSNLQVFCQICNQIKGVNLPLRGNGINITSLE